MDFPIGYPEEVKGEEGVSNWKFLKAAVFAAGLGTSLCFPFGKAYAQDSIESRLKNGSMNIGPIESVWHKMMSEATLTIDASSKDRLRESQWSPLISILSRQVFKKRDGCGFPLFDRQSVGLLQQANVPLSYIEDLLNVKLKEGPLRGYQVYRYFRLGMKRQEIEYFKDTVKPNAVIIYPFEDKNQKSGEMGAFDSKSAIHLFTQMKASYDVWVKIAYSKQQVFEALDFIPDISLFMISGHGDQESLTLSTINPRTKEKGYGDGVINIETVTLREHSRNLLPDAVIFLCSCSNGKGGLGGKNLANVVYSLTGNRRIIAAKDNFSLESIHVGSSVPLGITIYRDGTDITYNRDSKR